MTRPTTRLVAPTRDEILEVLERDPDITVTALGEIWEIRQPTMSKILRRYGLRQAPPTREVNAFEMPWSMRPEDLQHRVPRLLRIAGKLRRGEDVPESNASRVNSLRRLVEDLDAADAALTYDPESANTGDKLWPWWAVHRDRSDRVIEIPGIGELRLSLWHIPAEALSARERKALEAFRKRKGAS